jgi:uncharacterized membrane protein (UPF0127 family)
MGNKRVKILLNGAMLDLEVVKDEASMKKGLSGVESIPEDGGMMFLWKDPLSPIMIMPDMKIDLDFIAFDKDMIVRDVKSANKDHEGDLKFPEVIGIIEVNKGLCGEYNIKEGDKFDIIGEGSVVRFKGGGTTKNQNKAQKIGDANFEIDDVLVKNGKMYLLDEDGEIAMELDGNERIFSIAHTKELFDLSKKAEASGNYDALGGRLKEIMAIHNSQEPEFAEKV